jgi:hypothetical protein
MGQAGRIHAYYNLENIIWIYIESFREIEIAI